MKWNAEDLSQRIFDLRLLDQRQLENVWGELGSREISVEDFSNRLLNKGLLTNFQLDKVLKGDREGFFYGNYRVLYMVGSGTFARVFRSVHTKTKKVVALKVLRRRYRTEPDQVDLFLREAHMGEKLVHPNIVRIFDVSDNIQAPYMVMEFVEGQTLREFLKVRKRLDVPTSVNLMIDVASALDYARKIGITHRDMKLSNVMVASNGKAKLVDFGLATMSEASDDKLLAAPNARSIDYVALERGTNVRKNDHRSDIYFAGCVFYHMMTGVAPLVETRDRLVRMSVSRFGEIKPANEIVPDIPIPVLTVLNHALCFKPEERYQEPEVLLADLKRVKFVMDKGEAETADAGAEGKRVEKVRIDDEAEGLGKTVLVVESNHEAQNLLREQLKKRGYRVLITNDPARALQRFEDEIRTAHCAIFSAQDLGMRAVEAFNHLGEGQTTSDIPAVLLVDKREKELTKAAKPDDHRLLLPMPLKIKSLREALIKLLKD